MVNFSLQLDRNEDGRGATTCSFNYNTTREFKSRFKKIDAILPLVSWKLLGGELLRI